MDNKINPNNIHIEKESVLLPFTDENKNTYENEDNWLKSIENEIDKLYISKLFVS